MLLSDPAGIPLPKEFRLEVKKELHWAHLRVSLQAAFGPLKQLTVNPQRLQRGSELSKETQSFTRTARKLKGWRGCLQNPSFTWMMKALRSQAAGVNPKTT